MDISMGVRVDGAVDWVKLWMVVMVILAQVVAMVRLILYYIIQAGLLILKGQVVAPEVQVYCHIFEIQLTSCNDH